MSGIGPTRQLRRMQWIAIILVTAAIALNYMDRSTLAIGNLKIRQEFGISATAIGALGSAWALTYGFAHCCRRGICWIGSGRSFWWARR